MTTSNSTNVAAIYSRSATKLVSEKSMDGDVLGCRAFVQRKGWDLTATFVDHAVSGRSSTHRPGLDALMAAAEEGAFSTLVMSGLDRISRDLFVAMEYVGRLRRFGVTVWLSSGMECTDPWQAILLMVDAEQSRQQSRDQGRRVQAGMVGAAARRKISQQAALPPAQARARGYGRAIDPTGLNHNGADHEQACQEYADQNNWTWCGFDWDATGLDAVPNAGPIAPSIIEIASCGGLDVLVVKHLGDLACKAHDLVGLIDQLERMGVAICVVGQGAVRKIPSVKTLFDAMQKLERSLTTLPLAARKPALDRRA